VSTSTTRRAPLLALIAGLVALVVVAVVLATSGGEEPPATGAAAIVPGDALAYVHVSIDPARPAVKRGLALAERFPDYPLLREQVLSRLGAIASGSANAGTVNFDTDIRPWLGREAALALLNTVGSTAGSLIVLDVASQMGAKRFLARFPPAAQTSYRSAQINEFRGGTAIAFVSHYLAIGQTASVQAAIDVAGGHGASLQSSSAYRRASAGEPDGRVVDAYASVDGVRRVLAPAGGLVGALGALLYQPALDGVSISITPRGADANVTVHSVLDPKLAKLGARRSFSPALPTTMPSAAMLALDLQRLDQVAPRLLSAGAAGGLGGRIGPLLHRLGGALQAEGVDVQRDILSLFDGESLVGIVPASGGSGRPALVVVAPTRNEARTRTALAALEAPLAGLFPPPAGNAPGQAPVFNDRVVAGVTAHQLVLTAGLELDYAVFDNKVVVSTDLQGIAAVRNHARSLTANPSYQQTLGNRPERVSSLLFLDFSQLLSLGEQTGLTRSARYRALRPDLMRIRAIGLSSTSGEADSTAELSVQIP